LKNNFFIIISNSFGKVLWNTSLGCLKFRNIEKKSIEAFNFSLNSAVEFILINNNLSNLFLKLEGIKFNFLKKIYKFFSNKLKKYTINFLGFKNINMIAYNGCKK